MRPLHLAVMGIVLSFVMWGSLFFTVLTQAHQTRQLLSIDNKLLAQQKQTLREQSRTITILNTKFDDLKNHDDCLFNLATRPNHSSAYIADAGACTIAAPATPSSSSAAAPRPQSSGTKVFVSSPSPQSAPNTNKAQTDSPAPKSAPVKSAVCKLTLGLLGC